MSSKNKHLEMSSKNKYCGLPFLIFLFLICLLSIHILPSPCQGLAEKEIAGRMPDAVIEEKQPPPFETHQFDPETDRVPYVERKIERVYPFPNPNQPPDKIEKPPLAAPKTKPLGYYEYNCRQPNVTILPGQYVLSAVQLRW